MSTKILFKDMDPFTIIQDIFYSITRKQVVPHISSSLLFRHGMFPRSEEPLHQQQKLQYHLVSKQAFHSIIINYILCCY